MRKILALLLKFLQIGAGIGHFGKFHVRILAQKDLEHFIRFECKKQPRSVRGRGRGSGKSRSDFAQVYGIGTGSAGIKCGRR